MPPLPPLPVLTTDLLAIYLHDHYAAATAGRELARRMQGANEGTELGPALERLAGQIDEDRRALHAIMARLGVRADGLKVAMGWLAEKAGRLKPNGRLASYSPLSRVLELEGLMSGVQAKVSLWRALRELAQADPRLDIAALDRLITRGQRQVRELREWHALAAREAFVHA